ncbi:hypothetical protein LguiB_021723 [Lonicera macranthoides]
MAHDVFDEMPERRTVADWLSCSIVSGCAQNGPAMAIEIFKEMVKFNDSKSSLQLTLQDDAQYILLELSLNYKEELKYIYIYRLSLLSFFVV